MRRFVTIAAVLLVCSAVAQCRYGNVYRLDPALPFRVDLGRGSGMFGLETVRIDETGTAVLHRQRDEPRGTWETATLRLSPPAVCEVAEAAETSGVLRLRRSYVSDMHDGTQWVFWVRQGGREKSIYFDNVFPDAITRFADQLDDILDRAGAKSLTWQPVPASESRKHQRELWDSINR